MKISNLQQVISQPLSALKSLGLGAPSSSGTSSSSSGSGLVETLTSARTSISVPAGAQAFTALKNLLKSAGSISAANTLQSDFARLAEALSGNSAAPGVRRPGAYQEQSSLAAAATSNVSGTVSLVG